MRPRDDLAPLEKAFRFASENHKLQTRDSGDPYMVHPLMVAHLLADMRMDLVSLETGLLHDVVEDTSVTIEDVRKNFGEDVARCVDGVTKLSKLDFFSAEERQAESFRKMLLAMVNDIRVIIVKLADRQHNMRTLGFIQNAERRERIARETIEIYAPIAHRLGMGKIRGELEDLAFRHIDPPAYEEITGLIESGRHANEELLGKVRQMIEAELRREGIPARVEGRLKRAYSIYQKMKRQKITIEQVYDLMAVRIVTDSVKNCYAALGVIHNEWRPVPGRIKDFIAIPRPNLYQSLHTSVVGPEGRHFEVQIRTEEMHRIAEEGIAAHWKYKEGKKGPADDDHPDVVHHRQQHFAEALRLPFFGREEIQFAQLGDAIHAACHVLAEVLANVLHGDACVFHHVVQQARFQADLVHAHVRQQVRHHQRMHHVGVAGIARLQLVILGSETEGSF